MATTSRMLNPEVFERLKAVLIYHGDNLKEHQDLLKMDTNESMAAVNQPDIDRQRVISSQIGKVSVPEDRHSLCIKEIMENGTPSLDEIMQDIKLFFEGPINLDLMLLASFISLDPAK